jgi:hypothetical protein
MTFKNIDEYAFNDNLRMIEDRYKDDIATIDTLDIDIAEVESRFDNSTIG